VSTTGKILSVEGLYFTAPTEQCKHFIGNDAPPNVDLALLPTLDKHNLYCNQIQGSWMICKQNFSLLAPYPHVARALMKESMQAINGWLGD
jgi:hypothetical protein